MIEVLFGNTTAARVLLYLQNYDDGYALGIAQTFGVSLYGVQRQLRRLETGGVLVSRTVGRTRVYAWNPRYALLSALRALLSDALESLPPTEIKAFYRERRRPRRPGKPL